MLRFLPPLLLALVALPVSAQSLRPDAVFPRGDEVGLQVEALWLLDGAAPTASPLERLVAPSALPSERHGLRPERSGGPSLGASLSVERGSAAMALLCRQGAVLSSFGSLAEHCLLATVDADDDLLGGLAQSRRAGLELRDAVGGIDFGFGLFWLRPSLASGASAWSGFGPFTPALLPELRGAEFSLSRGFALGDGTRLVLGGGLTQQQWRSPALASVLDTRFADLSLALEMGDFSGLLSGRRYFPTRSDASPLQVLDLGVSWRTPWQGQFSVGAHNILGRQAPASPAAQAFGLGADVDLLDELPQGRVPFVRYRQEL